MIRVGGDTVGGGGDVEFCGLFYPQGDQISRHMAKRLRTEPFYQSDKLADALQYVKRRRTAVDCGAWVGAWSRELAKHFSLVHSIEAQIDNARCIGKNNPDGNVRVHNLAVSDSDGWAFIDNDGARVGSHILNGHGDTVPMFKLDSLHLFDVDYMKIHVNGAELRALKGAEQTIKLDRPILTVVVKSALANAGDTEEQLRDWLKAKDYRRLGGEAPYQIWGPQ